MRTELTFRIILENPTPGVDYGLQEGKGSKYNTIQIQKAKTGNLLFEFNADLKTGESKAHAFTGPFVHGPATQQFVYIDIGTPAGQKDSPWTRRLKIPLKDIDPDIIKKATANPKLIFETTVPGSGKDGGPNCATVKPFSGWKLKSRH